MKEYQVNIEDNEYEDISDSDYKELLKLGYNIAELNDELSKLASSIDGENHYEIVAHFIMLGNIAYRKRRA